MNSSKMLSKLPCGGKSANYIRPIMRQLGQITICKDDQFFFFLTKDLLIGSAN